MYILLEQTEAGAGDLDELNVELHSSLQTAKASALKSAKIVGVHSLEWTQVERTWSASAGDVTMQIREGYP